MTNEEAKQKLQSMIDWTNEIEINNLSKRFKNKMYKDLKDYLSVIQQQFKLKSIIEVIYMIRHDMSEPHKCIDCNSSYTPFLGYNRGYKERCGKCGLIHSAKVTREILNSKSDEEKKAIIAKNQAAIKANRERKLSSINDSWKNLTRQEIKDYLIQLFKNNPGAKRGIANTLLYKRPDIYKYTENEMQKFGYTDRGVILYMIMHDMIEPPKCIDCKTNYAAFFYQNGENQFSQRCTKCGLSHGAIIANENYKEKHNGIHVLSNPETRAKIEKTLLEKTGYRFAMQNPVTKQKSEATVTKNHGGFGFASLDTMEKIDMTMLHTKSMTLSQHRNSKLRLQNMISNCRSKRGTDFWFQTEEGKKKLHDANFSNNTKKLVDAVFQQYGYSLAVPYYNAMTSLKVIHEKCGRSIDTTSWNQIDQFAIDIERLCPYCYPRTAFNKPERFIMNYIGQRMPNITVLDHCRTMIGKQELDLFYPDYRIAIEYCGLWCHSSNDNANSSGLSGKDSNYHRNKFLKCQEQGIQLFTIFEDEDDKLSSICDTIIELMKTGITKLNCINGEIIIDNRFSSYEFLSDKDKYQLVKTIEPRLWFWKGKRRIEEFKFQTELNCNKETQFGVAIQNEWNWIYDCGYQIIKMK